MDGKNEVISVEPVNTPVNVAPVSVAPVNIAQWRSQYETGDALIDSQHQSIFSAINALNGAMIVGQGESLIKDTLEIVKDYTILHFESEEQFMLRHDYPYYEDHKSKHQAFRDRIDHLIATTIDQRSLVVQLSHILTHWFIHHIKEEDQKMINFCKGDLAESTKLSPANAPLMPSADEEIEPEIYPESMVLAQWNDRYETGYTLIDDQHKSLFHAINALHNAMLTGHAEDLLQRTLKTLQNYTTIHFETEEQFMLKTHYPDYEMHQQKHQLLRKKVEEFLHCDHTQNSKKLSIEVSHFLTNWLINHIKLEDQKMINFLREERLARLASNLSPQ
jgi:hemerythrin